MSCINFRMIQAVIKCFEKDQQLRELRRFRTCPAVYLYDVMYRTILKLPIPPPPGQTPEHLTFLKKFGQIPRYVASFDVKCPTR